MGKYMKKSKIAGDVAVVKVPTQSSLGVRTRAKTLALQSHCKSSSSSSPMDADGSSFSYLQLRSRRLRKVMVGSKKPPPSPPKSHGNCCRGSPNSNCRGMIANSKVRESSVKPVSLINEKGHFAGEIAKGTDDEEDVDMCVESSFGENVSDVEDKDRSTGDSPPCSLTWDSNTMSTPASTTKQIACEHVPRNIPTAYEMEEFFAFAEKQQHRIFMEKYNFDVVNDVPLPGRYEWVQVLH
ncbi:cyclin-dependent kinase inhibitor 3 isoform X2 [Neltuma alba]|nr:cyclin-dependent kinase inhibitor 3-like isoform X2 [Prosopis alba]